MIKIIKKIEVNSKCNLVFLINSKNDLSKINYLNLDKKIILDIKSNINNKNSFVSEYFLWEKNINKITIIYLNIKKNNLFEYLGSELPKLKGNIVLLSNNESNVIPYVESFLLSRYKFQKYITEKQEDNISIILDNQAKEVELLNRIETIKNILWSRDLVNMPTHDKTPEIIENIIKNFKFQNIKIRVLDYDKIRDLWLNLIYNVGKSSIHKPKLIILEKIVNYSYPTYWFIWKWVIFDTGWLNIKPTNWLYDMKTDMWWASQVIYTMKELEDKDLNVNIIAAIPIVENSISFNSYRPSDIITAFNKKTVDINNTDAEWRLILADTMSYISSRYKINTFITTATLTWACLHALGYNYSWIMWNDKKIINYLVNQSNKSEEKYIELPYSNYFIEKTKSKIADITNHTWSVYAWASMWAAFLSHFCDNQERLVHIDIAWTAYRNDAYSIFPVWATWIWVDSLSKMFQKLK